MTSPEEYRPSSAEDRLSLLIDRLLVSMDAAASIGAWDRVVELANDVLAVDPTNRGAESMLDRVEVERSLSGGQRAFVSLIFADIVRSTDMAEVVEPEVIQDVFALYRRVAGEAIEELGGRVLQFQGDGVVACFGYPTAHDDDARRAVLAGMRLIERMAHAAIELDRRHGIEPDIRIGVHSGTVVVAGLASGVLDGSALAGSVPNVAARLQGEAEPGTVVISDTTRHLVEPHFELKPAGTRLLKGILRPMDVHLVVRSNLTVPPSGRGLPESVVLVGREGQTRFLRFVWKRVLDDGRRAARPEGSVGVIRGTSGIGKSALAAELAAHVRLEGGVVLEAYCSPYHGNVALWPVARMLEQLPGLYPDQPAEERLNELEARLEEAGLGTEALPLVAPLLGLEANDRRSRPEVDALALRQQTLQILAAWLAHTAASTPTLVVAEDIHWADPTTIDLLGLLAAKGAPGTMVLITSQLPLTAPWASAVVDIELEPLKEKDAAGLVASLSDNALDPEEVRLIVERGAGNPLFLQELTRSALNAHPGEVLPPRIHEILTARLHAPGIDLRVAQLAATLGAEFDQEQLRQLAGRTIDDALARLEDAALIERVAEPRLGRYRFRQSLLRDTAYETQVLPVRQETHRGIAELLGPHATSPGDLAVVAQHWDLTGDLARTIPAYIVAAQAAQAAASHTEACQQLARALELTSTLPEDDERHVTELMIRSQRTLSTSSKFGYGHPDVLEDFKIAEGICRRLTNRPEIMPAQVGIWSYLLVRGLVQDASLVIEPLADTLDDPASAWFAPEIRSCMGYSAFYQGRLDDAHRWLVAAWEGYCTRSVEAASSPFWPLPHDAVPITAVALACVAALQGSTEESAMWERRAVASAEELDFPTGPFSAAFVSVYLAWIRMMTGNLDEAREFGQRTMEIAERCHFDYFRLLGSQYLLIPGPDRPLEVQELEALAFGMDLVGHAAFRSTHLGIVAQNHHFHGDVDSALRVLEEALVTTATSGELIHQPDLLRLRAEITAAAHPERDDEVVEDLVAAVEIGLTQGSLVFALRAANDLGRLPHEPPSDWSDRIRSVLERFPPNSSSPSSLRRSNSWGSDVTGSRGSVAILGGGVGALATAFELTEGDWQDRFDRITVYQRGWRLGGKGASSRGANGRIEEHGLHVLLGYYDRTFDLMNRCYDALDRDRTDPTCPIRTLDDAVAPSNSVGVVDHHNGAWEPWVATFSPVAGLPGTKGGAAGSTPLAMADLVVRSVRLLIDFFASLPFGDLPANGSIGFSTSPTIPSGSRGAPSATATSTATSTATAIVQGAGLIGLVLPLGWAQAVVRLGRSWTGSPDLAQALPGLVEPIRGTLRAALDTQAAPRRSYELIELVTTNLQGIMVDGLLTRPEGFGAINHLDYREWLLHHGIDPAALESPILRGMYDLVFAYEAGDPARPRFSAGLGLDLATKMLLGYSGALFWKMQAGMGDVIFAPLYEVLRRRGVEFRFFHRVDALRLEDDGRSIAAIDLGIQAEVAAGAHAYDPLIRVKGLPCWPDAPLASQLRSADCLDGVDLESLWSPRRDVGRCTLRAGEDFDAVVFAISLGMVPHICGELLKASPTWQSMVDHVETVATQAFQLWLSEDEEMLGWHGPSGATVSGFVSPFDTWASMSHLLPAEDWPETEQPRTIAYFCNVLEASTSRNGTVDAQGETRAVRDRARTFLERDVATLWPAAIDDSGFRWSLLCDSSARPAHGHERLDSQYMRANIDPSDRYVQSLPGTDEYRMQPGETGFSNLVVAGDWTDNGLNAGCVEGATRSGQLAATAVCASLPGAQDAGGP